MELVTTWDVKDLINGIIEDRGTAEPLPQENDRDSWGDSFLSSAEWRALDAVLASAVRKGQAARDDLRDVADGTLPRPAWMTGGTITITDRAAQHTDVQPAWPLDGLGLMDLADDVAATTRFIEDLLETRFA